MDGGRLIIVDDEPVILNLLASVFKDEPWDVTLCKNGREAEVAISVGVDVLLTDKNLPDLGGLELLKLAHERQPDAEVLVITAYASLDTALEAMELGAFDYIVKPPKNIFDVQRKVRQAFERIAVVRENKRLLEHLTTQNFELESALAELKESQAELIQSEKLAGIGTLAAGIAHEISSPLFGVMGLAEAIAEENELDLVRSYAKEIVDYSRTIKDIVVQLSGYSRTAESEYLTTVELPRVVEDAVKLVVRSKQVDPELVAVEVSEDGLYVNARTNEVQQVFVNLVKNAIEATEERWGDAPDAQVHVRLGRGEGHVWARVSDNGSGIAADKLSAIFDPFFTTKPQGRGTGLGLNIVYRILTKYRGTVSVESTQGQGACFYLRFPVET